MKKLLSDHYCPQPSEIVQRAKFYKRVRQPGESVATFLSELCSIAEYCNFGDSLETMLRDRLVCGINDDCIQQKSLSEETGLTLKSAVKLAQAMEVTVKDSMELKPPASQSTTQKLTKREPSSKKLCYSCASLRVGHTPDKCQFKNKTCHQCCKVGHIKRACRSKPQTL